jgi:hypothetical protein
VEEPLLVEQVELEVVEPPVTKSLEQVYQVQITQAVVAVQPKV